MQQGCMCSHRDFEERGRAFSANVFKDDSHLDIKVEEGCTSYARTTVRW
jgi:hypothetical protein